MAKKDLASLTHDLSALAATMPTQRLSTSDVPPEPAKPAAPKREEELAQFSMGLRKELRRQLSRLADDADMTMRAFVLNALKDKGLAVRPEDLEDLRKGGRR